MYHCEGVSLQALLVVLAWALRSALYVFLVCVLLALCVLLGFLAVLKMAADSAGMLCQLFKGLVQESCSGPFHGLSVSAGSRRGFGSVL